VIVWWCASLAVHWDYDCPAAFRVGTMGN